MSDVVSVGRPLARLAIGRAPQSSFNRGVRILRQLCINVFTQTIAFHACCVSLRLSAPGKHGDSRTSFRVLPGCTGDIRPRTAAHVSMGNTATR